MASVTLTYDYLHDVGDLTDFHSFTAPTLGEQPSDGSRFELMASGRVRAIFTTGKIRTYQISWIYVDRDVVAWLRTKERQLMLWRDTTGRAVYGMFLTPSISEVGQGLNQCHVGLTFVEVTYNPAV